MNCYKEAKSSEEVQTSAKDVHRQVDTADFFLGGGERTSTLCKGVRIAEPIEVL